MRVQLDGIAEAIGIVKRITDVLFCLLLLFYILHYSCQFEHYLLHSLKKLIVVLIRSHREEFRERTMGVLDMRVYWKYG